MKKDPDLACLRRAAKRARGALVMATSQAHAKEVVTDLQKRGYVANRCGKFIMTNAPFNPAQARRYRR